MADSETVDTTQQVTSKTPATRQKNPKCVAVGKAIAEKTRQAREAQKKALAEANVIIANNQLKQPEPPATAPPVSTSDKNVLTTTQWLSVISIAVSLAGIYYKREEIKGFLTPKKPQVYTPPPVLPKNPQVYTPPPVPPNTPVVPKKASNRWIDQLNSYPY